MEFYQISKKLLAFLKILNIIIYMIYILGAIEQETSSVTQPLKRESIIKRNFNFVNNAEIVGVKVLKNTSFRRLLFIKKNNIPLRGMMMLGGLLSSVRKFLRFAPFFNFVTFISNFQLNRISFNNGVFSILGFTLLDAAVSFGPALLFDPLLAIPVGFVLSSLQGRLGWGALPLVETQLPETNIYEISTNDEHDYVILDETGNEQENNINDNKINSDPLNNLYKLECEIKILQNKIRIHFDYVNTKISDKQSQSENDLTKNEQLISQRISQGNANCLNNSH